MQPSQSTVPNSALVRSRSQAHSSSSLLPMYAAEFRGKLESALGRRIDWGYWSHDEKTYGSYDCLILREGAEPPFRKADFVIAQADSVRACLKCVEKTPDPEHLLELFCEADEVFEKLTCEDLRVGFFVPEGKDVNRHELEKALRASGLTEVELVGQGEDRYPIWCFRPVRGKWTLTPFSIQAFLPEKQSEPSPLRVNAQTKSSNLQDTRQFHDAIRQGEVATVKRFLKFGQEVDSRDDRFNSALHIAAETNQVDCIRLLMEAGASWKSMNYKSRTPLHIAAANASAESLACLLDTGADPDVLMDRGISPLHMASWFGHTDMVHMLIQAGASINLLNEDGNSCLHLAAGNGQVKIVKTLIEFGADPGLTNHLGLTYLEVINEGYSGPAIPVI